MNKQDWISYRIGEINYNVQHLYEFYLNQDRPGEKKDFGLFQQLIAHYIAQGGNLEYYHKYYDNLFELMFLYHQGEKKIVI